MKKMVVFLLAMALLVAIGIPNLAAQQIDPENFNAVPTLSTEARYSAGLFTSDVDDFISVNDYDPDIGTFFFLGGFPAAGSVEETSLLATSGTSGDYAISAGFAKSFSKFYLGVYLGGTIVNAWGSRQSDPKYSFSEAVWDTKLAVLFGTSRIGGLRLDLILDGTDRTTRSDGKKVGTGLGSYGEGVTAALRWGKDLSFGSRDIAVHALAGFRFPDYELVGGGGVPKIHNWGTHATKSNGAPGEPAELLLNGGIAWDLNDVSTLEADLYLGGNFGGASYGDASSTTSGGFGGWVEAGLANTFEPLEGLELALKPHLNIGFSGDGGADTGVFEGGIGADAGLKARLPGIFRKFSIITGIGVNIFSWNTYTIFGSPRSTVWTIEGIGWNKDAFTAKGTLGLGMVFVPITNLSIGFGVNTLIDGIVEFDLVQMQVRAGEFFTDIDRLVFDLTVSYKF
jgi:hypothetical protein